jgi:hypothetical protein
VPVDVEHRQQVRARRVQPGDVGGGHRGQQLPSPTSGSQGGDLAADGLNLRGPVQPQHPTQGVRVEPGRAFGARLPGQCPQHPFEQHGVQAVEPVRQAPENLCGTTQQPSGLQGGDRQQQPGQGNPGRGSELGVGVGQLPPPCRGPLTVKVGRRRERRQTVAARILSPSGSVLPAGSATSPTAFCGSVARRATRPRPQSPNMLNAQHNKLLRQLFARLEHCRLPVSRPACHCIPSRSYSGTPSSRSPGTCTATSPTRARAPPSSGSQQQWADENVCRCYTNGYTAAKRPPRILSETASDLLFPVGMTGFEPATP